MKPLLLLILGLGLSAPAAAQDPRLEARLAPAVRDSVQAIIAEAARDSLPSEPLVQKALEGSSKHASGDAIVRAVRTLAGHLRLVRQALGPASTEPELQAGVAAFRAGVSLNALEDIRRLRESRGVAVPLSVLADLVARGIKVETASASVLDLARRQAADQAYVQLRNRSEGANAP